MTRHQLIEPHRQAINSSYYLLAGCRDCAFAALPCPSAVVLQQLIGMAARVLVLGPADTQAVAHIVSSRPSSSPSCQRVRRRWLPCRRTGQCTRRQRCCCSGTGRRRCVVMVGSLPCTVTTIEWHHHAWRVTGGRDEDRARVLVDSLCSARSRPAEVTFVRARASSARRDCELNWLNRETISACNGTQTQLERG